MPTRAPFLTAILCLACLGPAAAAGDRTHAGHDLGRVDFATSCAPAVRDDFNRGLALLHHMP